MFTKLEKYKQGNVFVCECGKTFEKFQSISSHFSHCKIHKEAIGETIKRSQIKRHSMRWENKTEDEIKEIHKKAAQTLRNRLMSGEIKYKPRYHSEETREKLRKACVERLKNKKYHPSYNKEACKYFDNLNKENKWNLQHALNGGEYKIDNYWVDAYDKNLNIVVEYDERKHYVDVYNNVLQYKDIIRQNNIIHTINCKFYRYNSETNILYEVKYEIPNKFYNDFDNLIEHNLIDFTNIYTIKRSLKKNSIYKFNSLEIYAETNKHVKEKINNAKEYSNKLKNKSKNNKKKTKTKEVKHKEEKLKKLKYKEDRRQNIRNILISLCETTNIDFTIFGWNEKFKKLLKENNLPSTNVLRLFNKYYKEFFTIYNPFIRKGSKYKNI